MKFPTADPREPFCRFPTQARLPKMAKSPRWPPNAILMALQLTKLFTYYKPKRPHNCKILYGWHVRAVLSFCHVWALRQVLRMSKQKNPSKGIHFRPKCAPHPNRQGPSRKSWTRKQARIDSSNSLEVGNSLQNLVVNIPGGHQSNPTPIQDEKFLSLSEVCYEFFCQIFWRKIWSLRAKASKFG